MISFTISGTGSSRNIAGGLLLSTILGAGRYYIDSSGALSN